jgi:holo-[acyl-carrier protein] synthase
MKASPYRVGIDIIDVHAIKDSIQRFGERFLNRVYTQEEQAYCLGLTSIEAAMRSLAARFAAKEATVKVLRPHDTPFDWRSIEIRRSPQGWCDIVLYEPASTLAQDRGITALSLSMSHENEFATAVVIADIDV